METSNSVNEEIEQQERRFPTERAATIDELTEQLFVVQKMGQWLAHETHGDAYVQVRELNELFHLANRKLRDIKNGTHEASKRFVPDVAVPALLR